MKAPRSNKKGRKKQHRVTGTRIPASPSPPTICLLLECSVLQMGALCAIGSCHYIKVPHAHPLSSAILVERKRSGIVCGRCETGLLVQKTRVGYRLSLCVVQGVRSSARRKARGRKPAWQRKTAANILYTAHHKSAEDGKHWGPKPDLQCNSELSATWKNHLSIP